MVRLRATAAMPKKLVQRYQTRAMSADGSFEVSARDAVVFRKAKWAEDAEAVAPAAPARRRGRPPKAKVAAAEPAPAPAAAEETQSEPHDPNDLGNKSNAELRAMAEAKGHELPSSYVRNDELIAMLQGDQPA